MISVFTAWLALILLALLTLRYLPFFNVELALRLQMWAADMMRKLDDWDEKPRDK